MWAPGVTLRHQLLPAWRRKLHLLLGAQVASYHDDGRRRPGGADGFRGQPRPEGRRGAPDGSARRQGRPEVGGMSAELRRLRQEDFPEDGERRRRTGQGGAPEESEVVFGVAPCFLALTQARRKLHRLLVKDGESAHRASVVSVCMEAHRRGVQVQRVSKRELDRMSSGGVHQGVCLQASPLTYLTRDSASAAAAREHPTLPLWLVLDRIQDPMNLGAILRSAYFLGVDRVASSLRHSCPLSPVVSKASSGVMEVLEVHGYRHLGEAVGRKAAEGWQVVGTVGSDFRPSQVPVAPCSAFRMSRPTLLLMGGEGGGLSQELLSLCHALLTVPAGRTLVPGIESLNVSVATGILLHSLLASRRSADDQQPRTLNHLHLNTE